MILEYTLVRSGDMSGCSNAEEIKRLFIKNQSACKAKCDAEKNCTYVWHKWNVKADNSKCFLYSSCNSQPDYKQYGGKLHKKPGYWQ